MAPFGAGRARARFVRTKSGCRNHEKDIIISNYPAFKETHLNDEIEQKLILIQQVIGAIRNIRGEMNVPPNKKAQVIIRSGNSKIIAENEIY